MVCAKPPCGEESHQEVHGKCNNNCAAGSSCTTQPVCATQSAHARSNIQVSMHDVVRGGRQRLHSPMRPHRTRAQPPRWPLAALAALQPAHWEVADGRVDRCATSMDCAN